MAFLCGFTGFRAEMILRTGGLLTHRRALVAMGAWDHEGYQKRLSEFKGVVSRTCPKAWQLHQG